MFAYSKQHFMSFTDNLKKCENTVFSMKSPRRDT